MPVKKWAVTYEDGTQAVVTGAPDVDAARKHAEHPQVQTNRNPGGTHGRATITEKK